MRSKYVWGENSFGELGNNTKKYSNIPVKIMDNVKKVICNKTMTAITNDNELYLWGCNRLGQLLDGTSIDNSIPQCVMNDVVDAYVSTSVGVLTKDGKLYTWGANYSGQLGDGYNDKRGVPEKIMDNVKLPTTTETLSYNTQQTNNKATRQPLKTIHPSTDTTQVSTQLVSEAPTNTYLDLTPNAEYMLYVVNSDESGTDILSKDNILYINQAQADESGNITFPDFVNSSWDNAKALLIGGTGDGIALDNTGIITSISSQTTVSTIKSQLHRRLAVFDSDFNEADDNTYISTGYTLGMLDSKGQIVKSYLVSIKGDLDGNGIINVMDMEAAQKHILGIKKLTGVYEQAGLITSTDNISVLDMEAMQKDILGIKKIAG